MPSFIYWATELPHGRKAGLIADFIVAHEGNPVQVGPMDHKPMCVDIKRIDSNVRHRGYKTKRSQISTVVGHFVIFTAHARKSADVQE